MKEKDLQSEINNIRDLMDRSKKFVPLSGLSGIMAGIYAFLGAGLAWPLLQEHIDSTLGFHADLIPDSVLLKVYVIVLGVLVLSVSTALILTVRKMAKRGENLRNSGRKELITRMAVPLITGGLLLNILLYHGDLNFLAPLSLIFYGIAMVAGSYYTISLVKYLGYSEIILGLFAAMFPGLGLYFWIIGFGLLHIIYGSILFYKYER